MSSVLKPQTQTGVHGKLTPENPWPGLASFRESDEAFFNGRRAETAQLQRRVGRARLTVLFAPSGMGKTSLLLAGLFPLLREELFLPVYIRLDAGEEGVDLVRQTVDTVVQAAAAEAIEPPSPEGAPTLWEYFHRRDQLFWTRRNRLITPILVFDQFEEMFTHAKTPVLLARSRAFLSELADLIEGRPSEQVKRRLNAHPSEARGFLFNEHPYKVILSLREDFLPELEELKTLMPSLVHNRMRLGHLMGPQALQVVRPEDSQLVDAMVAERIVRVAAGPRQEKRELEDLRLDPSILSVFCRELNEARLRRKPKLEKISAELVAESSAEILRGYYERCMRLVGPEARRFVEDSLLTPTGYRDSVDLDNLGGVPRGEIDILVDRRLLRIEEHSGRPRLELAHDVLTGVVRESRDRRKLREERDAARAAQAEAEHQALRTRRRARLQVALVTAVAFIVVLAVAGVSFWLRFREAAARASRTEAEANLEREQSADALAFLAHAAATGTAEPSVFGRIKYLLLYRGWGIPELTLTGEDASAHLTDAFPVAGGTQVLAVFSDGSLRSSELADEHRSASFQIALEESGGAVSVMAVDPAGRSLISRSGDGIIRVHRLEPDAPQAMLEIRENVYLVAYDPSGERILVAAEGRPAQIRDLDGGAAVDLEGPTQETVLARFSPDGGRVVTVSGEGAGFGPHVMTIWDAAAGRRAARAELPLKPTAASFSPDGRRLLLTTDQALDLWTIEDGDLESPDATFRHDYKVNSAEFSPDGTKVLTASNDRTARIWSLALGGQETVTVERTLRHRGPVRFAGFDETGAKVVTVSGSKARLWDVRTGAPLSEPLQHGSPVRFARFLESDRLLTLSEADEARVWSFLGGYQPTVLRHGFYVYSADFDANGVLATASWDGKTRLWSDAEIGETSLELGEEDFTSVNAVSFNADGSRLVTATYDGTVELWDPRSGERLDSFPKAEKSSQCSARSSHSGSLVVRVCGSQAAVWDWERERVRLPIPGRVQWAEFSHDDRLLVTASADGIATIWNLRETAQPVELRHRGPVHTARFSSDGRRVLTASEDGRAQLWWVADGTPQRWVEPGGSVQFAAFDPRSERIATASEEGARIWEADSGRPVTPLMWHGGSVRSVEFSSDGGLIVTRSDDRSARVWDARTGSPLTPPLRHDADLTCALFDPQARRLVTCSSSEVRVWDVAVPPKEQFGDLVRLAEAVAGSRARSTVFRRAQLQPWPDGAGWLQELRASYPELHPDGSEHRAFLDRFFRAR